jgi:pyruvate formate lyase activating enzyme
MGCIFCHNPESWDFNSGEELDVETLLRRLGRFRTFLGNPGLTVSGGEPLAQPQFTLELVQKAKAQGWHVAVDTSGPGPVEPFREITQTADLVIFSMKHPLTPERLAPGCDFQNTLTNWRTLATLKIPVWLRYVLIPGWNDESESLQALGAIAKELHNLERLEVLPFNSLAKDKWAKMGKESPIFKEKQIKVSEEQILRAEQLIAWHSKSFSGDI